MFISVNSVNKKDTTTITKIMCLNLGFFLLVDKMEWNQCDCFCLSNFTKLLKAFYLELFTSNVISIEFNWNWYYTQKLAEILYHLKLDPTEIRQNLRGAVLEVSETLHLSWQFHFSNAPAVKTMAKKMNVGTNVSLLNSQYFNDFYLQEY